MSARDGFVNNGEFIHVTVQCPKCHAEIWAAVMIGPGGHCAIASDNKHFEACNPTARQLDRFEHRAMNAAAKKAGVA